MKNQRTIKVTVLLENSLWVGIFERQGEDYAAARKIFGEEPSDAELYDFVLTHLDELKFTEPRDFKLIIERKNYKRMQREVKRQMEKSKKGASSASHAQEVLRLELEKNKKIKKTVSRAERDARERARFLQKQAKKKEKHRGH